MFFRSEKDVKLKDKPESEIVTNPIVLLPLVNWMRSPETVALIPEHPPIIAFWILVWASSRFVFMQ